jgi:hypothetical protein
LNRVTYALDWIDARVSVSRGNVASINVAEVCDVRCFSCLLFHEIGGKKKGRSLKLLLHSYRARVALVAGQKNACKKEIKVRKEQGNDI